MADVLQSLSDDLAAAVEKAGQSIVRVEGRRRQSASGIVWSADGLIVTAHHVVERDEGDHDWPAQRRKRLGDAGRARPDDRRGGAQDQRQRPDSGGVARY